MFDDFAELKPSNLTNSLRTDLIIWAQTTNNKQKDAKHWKQQVLEDIEVIQKNGSDKK